MKVNTTFATPEFDGIYQVAIMEAKEGTSKNGTQLLELSYCIIDALDEKHIGHTVKFQKLYFSEKATGRSIKFLETLTGQKFQRSEEVEFDENQLYEHRITVQLLQDTYTNDNGEEKQVTKTGKFWPANAFSQVVRNGR